MKKHLLTLILAVVYITPMHAVHHYFCDFEDAASRNRWVLAPTANANIYNQLANKWYIGEPGNNDHYGHNGLFISDDGGQNAHYTNKGCLVFAYDTISLDHISGDYLLTFDYRVMANMGSYFDGLYVLWIPMTNEDGDTIKVLSIPNSAGTIPSTYEDYVLCLQPNKNIDYVNGSATWRQCAVKIKGSKCDGTPHYLAFVWANGTNQAQQPGGMVDNINISDNIPCNPVTDLVVALNGTTVNLQWQGTAIEYEVSAYTYETNTWAGPKIVTSTQTNFTGLPVGQTDFIVRSRCNDDFYSLKTIVSQLIYYPDQMCINYMDLTKAKCYIENSQPKNTLSFDDYIEVPAVDYGPANTDSRHTVHWDKNETDPRTNGEAYTIPDGELASVRLGNWDTGNQTERIEFFMTVDTAEASVLHLKYLPVLEAPGHEDYMDPRFRLEVLMDDGLTLDTIARADFDANDVLLQHALTPEAEAQGWHLARMAGAISDVVWKEWTTVGVNLNKPQYHGQTMTIRLTTHDCAYSAHFGYAYFTLDCADGKLKTRKNDDGSYEFTAPDGFVYRWYRLSDDGPQQVRKIVPEDKILSHEQSFVINADDEDTYAVDCIFVQDSTNYFTLTASVPQDIEGLADVYVPTLFPTLVSAAQQIPVVLDTPSQVRFISLTGAVYSLTELPSGTVVVTAPSVPGVYVVDLVSAQGHRTTQQLIVQ